MSPVVGMSSCQEALTSSATFFLGATRRLPWVAECDRGSSVVDAQPDHTLRSSREEEGGWAAHPHLCGPPERGMKVKGVFPAGICGPPGLSDRQWQARYGKQAETTSPTANHSILRMSRHTLGSVPSGIQKKQKTSLACRRCRTSKVKCSGEQPCRNCRQSKHPVACVYPPRDRDVVIKESYLNQLETEIQALRPNRHSNKEHPVDAEGSLIPRSPVLNPPEQDITTDQTATKEILSSAATGTDLVAIEHIDTHATKPLHVRYTSEGDLLPRYSYVGDAACEAFNTRVRRHLRNDDSIAPPKHDRYFKTNTLRKLVDRDLDLPDQGYAMLLIETAERFVGSEYHMFLRRTFLHQFDEVYKPGTPKDPVWLCGLFAILALGELYSNIPVCAHRSQADIPGTGFFLRALDLFEDLYEEPTVSYIETVLLLSYYSHALNRRNSAYIFTGLAMRLSMALGLHRELPAQLASPFEHEHRRRVWWTVYAFDRLCSLKLGHPVMIKDEDISVNLPSHNNLTSDDLEDLPDPKQILSSIAMARIAGSILQDLYQPRSRFAILPNVQKILAQLKDFIQSLPDELSLAKIASTACPGRALASLHVHCNHCIVLTTRPVFFQHFQSQATLPHVRASHGPCSAVMPALADACVSAATTCYKLLRRLWVNGQIVTLGGFDSQYLFSAATILAMSHSLKPTNSSRTLLEGSSSMLRIMGTSGNIPARGYYEQLAELKHDLELCKGSAGEVNATQSEAKSCPIQADRENATEVRRQEPTDITNATATTEPDDAHTQYNLDIAAILNAPDINEFLTFESLDELGIEDPGSQSLWWSPHDVE